MIYVISVFLFSHARLFIDALWSPACRLIAVDKVLHSQEGVVVSVNNVL